MKRIISVALTVAIIFALSPGAFSEEQKSVTNLADLFAKGDISGRFRSYYMNRTFDKSPPVIQESMASGGWLQFNSAKLHGFSMGLTGYTSQGMFFVNRERDGANLLKPGQKGFSVLGQSYLQWDGGKNRVRLYRQSIDTPFLNPYDVKMVPVTFEAYTLENSSLKNCTVTLSHITRIKRWTDTGFVSLSEAAGFKGTNEPVTLLSLDYSPNPDFRARFYEYYCRNFMNTIYLQVDRTHKTAENTSVTGSFQAIHQRDLGRALGGRIKTGMLGAQASITRKRANGVLGYTITSRGGNIVNPWGGYYGFTSIMEEDNDMAGEKAWVFAFNYDFKTRPDNGLSLSLYHTRSHFGRLGSIHNPLQKETNLTFSYQADPQCCIRLRGATVRSSHDMGGINFNDFRVIVDKSF